MNISAAMATLGNRAMAATLRFALACLLAGAAAATTLAASPKEGQAAPRFEAVTLDGHTVSSSSLQGKVTLVHFWATWCPPCLEEMPALEAFYRAHQKDGFEVVAVSIEDDADEAKVREFAKRFSFPVAMKGKAKVDEFGRLWVLPLSFLIDRKQMLRKTDWTGAEKIDADALDKLVLPLLAN